MLLTIMLVYATWRRRLAMATCGRPFERDERVARPRVGVGADLDELLDFAAERRTRLSPFPGER